MRSVFEPDVRAFVARADALSGIGALPPPSLAEYIAGWITDRIQFGDFRPGEPIRELMVADQFDVSRGPVRDAFRLLDRNGLIVISGRKGAVVRTFTREETGALFRLRAEMFGLQAGLAASTPDPDPQVVKAMVEGADLLAALAEAAPTAPVGEYITVRRAISRLIASLSGNIYLAYIGADLEREVAVLWASVLNPERRRQSAATWMELCRAVGGGQVADAERLGAGLVLGGLAEIQRRWADPEAAGES